MEKINSLTKVSVWNREVKLLGLMTLLLLLSLGSCQKDEFTDSMDADISFSTDTLRFDTVFTERATITRYFKIYNKNKKAVRIKDIHLEEPNSFFRFNIDGYDQSEVDEVIVWGNDSIYVFVEATIDPDEPVSVSPFIIEDNLIFNVNGNLSRVVIEAFGQNANYVPARDATGGIVLLSCGGGTVVWDDPKPYVIFGVLVIDDCTLIWPAGTRVYVHGGIAREEDQVYNDGLIYVGANGKLRSEGLEDNPVIVQGDRLEPGFAQSRGQWSGIRLASNSGPHHFKYTEIKNSIVGLRSDSASVVNLEQVKILNTSGPGLVGIHNSITAVNLLVANNGGHSIQLTYGGHHEFHYTTLANFGNQIEALRMDNVFCYDPPECEDVRANPQSVKFVNSIIAGSGRDQIVIIDATQDQFGFMNYDFEHCLVRVFQLIREDRYSGFLEECEGCYNFELFEPVFASVSENDYRLDSLSIAIGMAKPLPQVTTIDLLGNLRSPDTPDVGAYEWKPVQ